MKSSLRSRITFVLTCSRIACIVVESPSSLRYTCCLTLPHRTSRPPLDATVRRTHFQSRHRLAGRPQINQDLHRGSIGEAISTRRCGYGLHGVRECASLPCLARLDRYRSYNHRTTGLLGKVELGAVRTYLPRARLPAGQTVVSSSCLRNTSRLLCTPSFPSRERRRSQYRWTRSACSPVHASYYAPERRSLMADERAAALPQIPTPPMAILFQERVGPNFVYTVRARHVPARI